MANGNSAANDIDQMQAQIDQYGSITQFDIRISQITGGADNPNQSSGYGAKSDGGFGGYDGSWEIGNWGDTLHFTDHGSTGNSAATDIDQMQAQISQYGSITQFGTRISEITGGADNPKQDAGTASKTDGGFGGYNGTWEVGNWGDTLRFTQ